MVTARLDIKPLASGTTITTTGETLPAGGELSPAQETVDTLTGTNGGFQKILEGTPLAPLPTFLQKCYERGQNSRYLFLFSNRVFLLETLD